VEVEERAACRAMEVSGTGIVGSVVTVDILFRMGRNGSGEYKFHIYFVWAYGCK
jgi:hypothetical protein